MFFTASSIAAAKIRKSVRTSYDSNGLPPQECCNRCQKTFVTILGAEWKSFELVTCSLPNEAKKLSVRLVNKDRKVSFKSIFVIKSPGWKCSFTMNLFKELRCITRGIDPPFFGYKKRGGCKKPSLVKKGLLYGPFLQLLIHFWGYKERLLMFR